MTHKLSEATQPLTGKELAELTATVSRWGMEAGFLGIEGHLEGRMSALVREASVRLFGNCEAERDRLLCRIEAMEKIDEEYRERRTAVRERRGLIGWFLTWFAGLGAENAERRQHRRNDTDLRQARLDFETAELTRRDACEWREMASQSLRASYEYQKARAAAVRPVKEKNHDTRDHRQFIVHRAN